MNDDKKQRLFLAVNLSVASTRKIADGITRLRGAAERKGIAVSWVPPANLHVTLKFLGWSDPSSMEAIRDRVRALAAGRKGFDVLARGVGAFPNETAARVLWVGVVAQPALSKLAADVEAAMVGLGFPKETRPYAPHVTLGRMREATGAENLLSMLAQADFGASLIREVVLYESAVESAGSEYIARFRTPLEAPPYRAERQTRDVEEGSTDQESEDPDGGQQPT